ncbi:MAG: 2-isopropylmalate synthase [Alphaproteobacteria bacterium]|nr:2-isopropylmalate synthase [Alphaproteobacteria bacterium]
MSDSTRISEDELVYDWNIQGDKISPPMRKIEYFDETLRDGIQCPSVTDPPIEAKMEMIRLMDQLGVHHVDIGLPGAGQRAVEDCTILAEMIRDEGLSIHATCAARTHPNDIRPVIEISQKVGIPIEVMAFLGTSPVRLYTEKWSGELLEERTRDSVRMAKTAGVPVTFVTEDTVRSHPVLLARLFNAAIDEGVDGLCLCDTVGHATPDGVFNLVHFAKNLIRASGAKVRVDWHGHNDRGHALPNALVSIEAGVDRVHGTVLGMGERVGNTSLDLLMVNLKLLGQESGDLGKLVDLVELASEACEVPIPVNYPVFGRDAFRTGTGVHASAVVKAMREGADWLADRIYSGVPAAWVGRRQEIEVGHYSGMSNVVAWLVTRDIEPEDGLVNAIFSKAKAGNRLLEEDEINALIQEYRVSAK